MANKLMQIEDILDEIYKKYSSQGIASIYLWGSILTEDFDEKKSDIDSIAFVEDFTPIELQKEICDELARSDVSRLHLNFVYISEFNIGVVKGGLCTVIDPRLLILDFPFWKHVAGKQYKIKDFDLPKPDYKQAIEIHLQNIKRRQWQDVSKISLLEREYFIKEVARFIHVSQSSRSSDETPFSYTNILRSANDEERPIVEAINELRANNDNNFDRFTPVFQRFIDSKITMT